MASRSPRRLPPLPSRHAESFAAPLVAAEVSAGVDVPDIVQSIKEAGAAAAPLESMEADLTTAGSGSGSSCDSGSCQQPDSPLEGMLQSSGGGLAGNDGVENDGVHSDDSNDEFSFGTTQPAALPPPSCLPGAEHAGQSQAASSAVPPDGPAVVAHASGSVTPTLSRTPQRSPRKSPRNRVDSGGGMGSDDDDAGPEFTFGTTTPFQLPDPKLLPPAPMHPVQFGVGARLGATSQGGARCSSPIGESTEELDGALIVSDQCSSVRQQQEQEHELLQLDWQRQLQQHALQHQQFLQEQQKPQHDQLQQFQNAQVRTVYMGGALMPPVEPCIAPPAHASSWPPYTELGHAQEHFTPQPLEFMEVARPSLMRRASWSPGIAINGGTDNGGFRQLGILNHSFTTECLMQPQDSGKVATWNVEESLCNMVEAPAPLNGTTPESGGRGDIMVVAGVEQGSDIEDCTAQCIPHPGQISSWLQYTDVDLMQAQGHLAPQPQQFMSLEARDPNLMQRASWSPGVVINGGLSCESTGHMGIPNQSFTTGNAVLLQEGLRDATGSFEDLPFNAPDPTSFADLVDLAAVADAEQGGDVRGCDADGPESYGPLFDASSNPKDFVVAIKCSETRARRFGACLCISMLLVALTVGMGFGIIRD